ncbi:MAG: 4-hydroxy-3-methylbut-2-enyl diphosphate reductase [Rhodospirillaceae bacterium]|jgi:4-hydroxy-3-methylbut-2-enyl diphosphate reductase|nr:4-hydroxy-3-methylbut-2-enyl diphosphate reductase [Rhodospirillaceae bacterium]
MSKRHLSIFLASPRGFCAGVNRAINIVEKTLRKFGSPIYVRHEIVHNRYVVDSLEKRGVIFVKELDDIPNNQRPVIFSAHGIPKTVLNKAIERKFFYIDATCPLVTNVHKETTRQILNNRQVIMIGHHDHPEVIGTIGQSSDNNIILIETIEQAKTIVLPLKRPLSYITQTTLSIDDTIDIINVLKNRFHGIKGPNKKNICYATTNRQKAVKAITPLCEVVLVIGATNSSNSCRLFEVASNLGSPSNSSYLVNRADEINLSWLDGINNLGITAGASVPEILINEVLEMCRRNFDVIIKEISITNENISFKLPPVIAS